MFQSVAYYVNVAAKEENLDKLAFLNIPYVSYILAWTI